MKKQDYYFRIAANIEESLVIVKRSKDKDKARFTYDEVVRLTCLLEDTLIALETLHSKVINRPYR